MKTEAMHANLEVKIEQNSVQIDENRIKLVLKDDNNFASTLVFAGYSLDGLKIALLKGMRWSEKEIAIYLLKQASMLAWELGYELLIASKPSNILRENGFEVIKCNENEIYCAELTWNALNKIGTSSIANFINFRTN